MKLFWNIHPAVPQTALSGMHQARHSTRIEEREETIVISYEDENETTEQITITETVWC